VHSILVILAGKALNLGVAVGSTAYPICFKDRGIGFQLMSHWIPRLCMVWPKQDDPWKRRSSFSSTSFSF